MMMMRSSQVAPSPSAKAVTPSALRHVFTALLVLGMLSLIISLGGRYFGGQIRLGGNTVSTHINEVVIADSVFAIPDNHIRHKEQRVSGVAARIDLFALWPNMTGYAFADRALFEASDHEAERLIFISIEPQQMSRDMSGRLDPIYRQLVEPLASASPFDGLKAHRFRTDHAIFSNEVLYVAEQDAGPPFVTRCIEGGLSETIAAECERDLLLPGGVSAKYRFPQQLLADHAALEMAVLQFLGRIQR
jgi:hypothetical protein